MSGCFNRLLPKERGFKTQKGRLNAKNLTLRIIYAIMFIVKRKEEKKMFRSEKMRELQAIDRAERKIDEELVSIKSSLKVIAKLEGVEDEEQEEFYNLINNMGASLTELKKLTLDKYNKIRVGEQNS